ncbi:MAG: 4-hydroxy-tetrahydrodipicolinate reductase [Dehalococcoidia bacterium]|nr:4-hydroxy-tetrahydrodipicolinate reductase [Dehalococcoidia bacterium]
MLPTRVVVNGALGRVGQEVVRAVLADPVLRLVGAVEAVAPQPFFPAPGTPDLVPFSSNLGDLLEKVCPHVIVDFTRAQVSMDACRIALPMGISMVIGSTGFSEGNLTEISGLCDAHKATAIIAPNFSLAAVVLMHLAKIASKYFDNAEIIEMHHDKKLDAPSGTAMATAKLMAEARGSSFVYPPTEKEVLAGARGGEVSGIGIHSVRMPGIMACQEVIFGCQGQTLVLRHDSTSRESYMPGVLLAVKEATKRPGFVFGLDRLLGL